MVFEFSFLEKEDEQACVDWNRKYKLIPWEGQEEGFQGHLVTLYRDGSCFGQARQQTQNSQAAKAAAAAAAVGEVHTVVRLPEYRR